MVGFALLDRPDNHGFSVRDKNAVKCPCGYSIGIDEGKRVKMKQRSFIYQYTNGRCPNKMISITLS